MIVESEVYLHVLKNKQLRLKKAEEEKLKLTTMAKENSEYTNLLNYQIKIYRAKFVLLSEYLNETLSLIKTMDQVLLEVDENPNKLMLFNGIDIDSLSDKKRKFKGDLEKFKNAFKQFCNHENDLDSRLQKIVKSSFYFFNHFNSISKMNNLKM